MYVCLCNGITDKQIRKAASQGCASLDQLQLQLGVASQCGSCADFALQILAEENGLDINYSLAYCAA
ncbi:MAG: bacterioferritin-associated ferredoxin [Pseudomonadales bacterium]